MNHAASDTGLYLNQKKAMIILTSSEPRQLIQAKIAQSQAWSGIPFLTRSYSNPSENQEKNCLEKNCIKVLNQTINTKKDFSKGSLSGQTCENFKISNANKVQGEDKAIISSISHLQDLTSFLKTPVNYCKKKNSSVMGTQFIGSESPAVSGVMPTATVEELLEPELVDEYLYNAIPLTETLPTTEFLDFENINRDKITEEEFNGDIDFEMIIQTDNKKNNTEFYSKTYNISEGVDSSNSTESADKKVLQMCENQQEFENHKISQKCFAVDQKENYHQIKEEFVQFPSPEIDFDQINVSENAIDISVCFDNENNSISLSQALSHAGTNPMLNQRTLEKYSRNEFDEDLLPLIYTDFDDTNLSCVQMASGIYENVDTSANSYFSHLGILSQSLEQNDFRRNVSSVNENSGDSKTKRRKMHLNTKNINSVHNDIDTPKIIDYILDFDNNDGTFDNVTSEFFWDQKSESVTFDDSLYSFLSSKDEFSNHSRFDYSTLSPYSSSEECELVSVKSLLSDHCQNQYTCSTRNNISSCPNAVETNLNKTSSFMVVNKNLRGTSISSVNHMIPNLPKSININNNSNCRRKRGRPSKEHSDRPDPKELQKLPESERKRREDRYKNNEASRISRQKNKKRQEDLALEEKILGQRNKELQKQISELEFMQAKFKKSLFSEIRWPMQTT